MPEKRPIAWVTWTILATTLAVFVVQLVEFHRTDNDIVGKALAFGPAAVADHHYWTVLTYAWAHAVVIFGRSDLFWVHIASSMIVLVCFGPLLEDYLGQWFFLGLYLGGAVVSGLTWYFFSAGADPAHAVIGSSGAASALLGAMGAAAPFQLVDADILFVIPVRIPIGLIALGLCAAGIIPAVMGWMPEVAYSAHLGGAVFGILYVIVLRLISRYRQSVIEKRQGRSTLGI